LSPETNPPSDLTGIELEAYLSAHRLREAHGLGPAPIRDVQELIEMVDPEIFVAVLNMPEGMDGMVVKDPTRGRTVVGVATTAVPERLRSSLAHELGHIVNSDYLGELPRNCAARTPSENRADTFARHLLAPREGIELHLRDLGATAGHLELAHLASVTRHFGVSPFMALIQLRSMRWLSGSQEQEWGKESAWRLAARFGWLEEYKARAAESQRPVPPRKLVARATEGYIDNQVSLHTLALLNSEDPDDLKTELEAAGIVPAPIEVLWANDDDFGPGN
jgi:Zn-dependent peptidase ImmA (M78 family)